MNRKKENYVRYFLLFLGVLLLSGCSRERRIDWTEYIVDLFLIEEWKSCSQIIENVAKHGAFCVGVKWRGNQRNCARLKGIEA